MTHVPLSAEVIRQHKGKSFVGISTCFFCHDGRGKFFMAKRSQNSRDEKGAWEIGGGGLKWGSTAEENMIRELKEEYGADPLKTEFIGYLDVLRHQDGMDTHWLALVFAVLVNPKQMKINEPAMFDNCGWFTLDTLPSPMHSQMPKFFQDYGPALSKILGPTV